MAEIPAVDYEAIRARAGECIHAARSGAQADLYVVEWEGRPALLKDFTSRPAWVRVLWARRIVGREVRALARLKGRAGFPELFATAGPNAFVMERLEAERLPRRRFARPSLEFWRRARVLMDELHEAGIGHGDLRRKNILIGPGEEPYLIDFATSARTREGGVDAWVSSWIFRRMRRVDQVTFARIKQYYHPESLDEDESRWLAEEPWYLRAGRWIKQHVYRLRKPGVLRKRLKRLGQRLWPGGSR